MKREGLLLYLECSSKTGEGLSQVRQQTGEEGGVIALPGVLFQDWGGIVTGGVKGSSFYFFFLILLPSVALPGVLFQDWGGIVSGGMEGNKFYNLISILWKLIQDRVPLL